MKRASPLSWMWPFLFCSHPLLFWMSLKTKYICQKTPVLFFLWNLVLNVGIPYMWIFSRFVKQGYFEDFPDSRAVTVTAERLGLPKILDLFFYSIQLGCSVRFPEGSTVFRGGQGVIWMIDFVIMSLYSSLTNSNCPKSWKISWGRSSFPGGQGMVVPYYMETTCRNPPNLCRTGLARPVISG